ncbi:16S rRNA (uracil1498-N3)-methyltransferase [Povalibacter uvarum]|uniref:Ribosomal RNA small subunit methyltransferase E n=1 Tax=Povalibacter uvarum TaxID=732238 RepID=A0A841HRU8_9GAMM|nr:16S rRNA (uracil(1498)-N(3))-methyltransferase [Povalibacter uvarum]MBB6094798.1 16S rRNA (uracil1498-N3)-methyltransferase [Povalibacter uvarum]
MRLNRIYCEGPLAAGATIPLSSAGAYHVARVLRMRPGAPLVVFDGSGTDHQAEIVAVEGDQVMVQLRTSTPGMGESPLRVTLVQGISRGERMDWTLQKATELGVTAIAPVLTARSVVRLDDKQATKKQAHWRAIVVGACEQCGRSKVPTVTTPISLRDYFTNVRKDGMRLVLSPSAPGSLAGIASLPSKVELLIGPEGGLDDDEIAAAQKAGYMPVRLGPRVLRTETAAVVALTVLQALWGDLQ